jgi:hypothetical protein
VDSQPLIDHASVPIQIPDAADVPAPVQHDSAPTSAPSGPTRPCTRLQRSIVKVKDSGPDFLRYDPDKKGFIAQVFSAYSESSKLLSYSEACKSPKWQQAMKDEYNALFQNETWQLVPPQPGHNLVDYKWVFKVKRHVDGSIERYKVRIVAKGFS